MIRLANQAPRVCEQLVIRKISQSEVATRYEPNDNVLNPPRNRGHALTVHPHFCSSHVAGCCAFAAPDSFRVTARTLSLAIGQPSRSKTPINCRVLRMARRCSEYPSSKKAIRADVVADATRPPAVGRGGAATTHKQRWARRGDERMGTDGTSAIGTTLRPRPRPSPSPSALALPGFAPAASAGGCGVAAGPALRVQSLTTVCQGYVGNGRRFCAPLSGTPGSADPVLGHLPDA